MKKKLKTLLANISTFLYNIKGFIISWWQVNVSQKDIIFSLWGFSHFSLAKEYARKRSIRNGLRHYVLPASRGATQLIVFNSRELKDLKRGGFVNKRVTIEVLLREAYYFTPNLLKRKSPKPVRLTLLEKIKLAGKNILKKKS